MAAGNEKRLQNIGNSTIKTVKRSVGYEDDEDDEIEQARKRYRGMSIDDGSTAAMQSEPPTP